MLFRSSLATFLMAGSPIGVEEDRIIVSFKYNFHFERIREPKNLAIIKEVLAKTYQLQLTVSGNIDESQADAGFLKKEAGQKSGNMVNEVLNTFGGEVVG